ncbi:MAG: hypothetical protein AAF709_06030, partial [Pseudomonadota bacterium]
MARSLGIMPIFIKYSMVMAFVLPALLGAYANGDDKSNHNRYDVIVVCENFRSISLEDIEWAINNSAGDDIARVLNGADYHRSKDETILIFTLTNKSVNTTVLECLKSIDSIKADWISRDIE